jgi:deoxyribonuclease-4
VHAPYFINLNATDEEWQKSRKRLMDAAHYGHLAGATDIVFHPGSYFGKLPEEVLPAVIERLAGCAQELMEAGDTVILRPEVMGKSAMIGSLEDVLRMSREVSGVAPCLDFAHLHARPGDGSMNTQDEWMGVLTSYSDSLGAESLKNLHIHLSGIAYSGKGEREHLPITESDMDIPALFKTLAKLGCGGRILCESPVMEDDAVWLLDQWVRISGERTG